MIYQTMVFIHLLIVQEETQKKFIGTLSAGKAYVRGFEVDKQTPTFLTFDKARTTLSKNNVASPFRIGNFLRVNNTFGLPDIDEEGDITSYSTINLYDTALGSSGNGTGGGQQIGFARVRAYEGNADSTDDEVYLFDITMFTKLGASGNFGSGFVQGIKVKGQSSGATGITANDSSSSSTMLLHSVVGTFQNETVQVFNDSSKETTTSLRIYDSGEIKRLHQDRGTGQQDIFGADVVLEDNFFLTGSASVTSDTETSSADTITGSASRFLSELVVGDKLLLPNGDTTIVTGVSSNTSITVTDISNTAEVITGNIIRQSFKRPRPNSCNLWFTKSRY